MKNFAVINKSCTFVLNKKHIQLKTKIMKATLKTIEQVRNEVRKENTRSAWSKGVLYYAERLLEDFEYFVSYDDEVEFTEKTALNGACNWSQWSWGGCGLVCDCDIAERLCTPTELKRTKNGQRNPNSRETWFDVQARAALQGWEMIKRAVKRIERRKDNGKTVAAEMVNGANLIYKDYTGTEERRTETIETRKTA